jgi:hypothetical protein
LVIGLSSTGWPRTKKPREFSSSRGFAVVAKNIFVDKSIATLSRFNR